MKVDESCFISQDTSTSSNTNIIHNNLFRKEALHLYGVDELSTSEIFSYFKNYKPFAVEWINDSSCNVVWKIENHAINALIGMTIPYAEDSEYQADTNQTTKSLRKPPQGTTWRIGAKSIKGYHIYMRFVRLNSDKKKKGAESRSRYYQKYGNPNYGNLKGLISSSRRKLMKEQQLNDAVADLSDLFDENPKASNTENGENDGRELVSYNIGIQEDQDIEEFGIENTSTRVFQQKRSPSVKKNIELKSDSNLKRKKMHMYADELNDSNNSSEDDSYSQKSIKRKKYIYIFFNLF